jgi:hypothetical protein
VNQRCISCARNALKVTCGRSIYNLENFRGSSHAPLLKRRKGEVDDRGEGMGGERRGGIEMKGREEG